VTNEQRCHAKLRMLLGDLPLLRIKDDGS
jgi:hypothetical protein